MFFFSGIYQSFLCAAWIQWKLVRFSTAPQRNKVVAAKEVRSLAKTLLKRPENRNNLLIWEWYAFAEGILEDKEEATTRILETVLAQLAPNLQDAEHLLLSARIVRFYVANLMGINSGRRVLLTETSSKIRALSVLVQFAEGTKIDLQEVISPNRLLKCRKAFEHLIENASTNHRPPHLLALGSLSCNLILCNALFEYFSNGFDVAAEVLTGAIHVHRSSMVTRKAVDFDVQYEQDLMDWEILTENYVRLALHHQKNSSIPSAVVRDILLNALRDFPDNPQLLNLFIHAELSAFISGRIRGYFDACLRESVTVVPWIFAIYSEYERKYRLWRNLNMAYEKLLFDGKSSIPDIVKHEVGFEKFEKCSQSQPSIRELLPKKETFPHVKFK